MIQAEKFFLRETELHLRLHDYSKYYCLQRRMKEYFRVNEKKFKVANGHFRNAKCLIYSNQAITSVLTVREAVKLGTEMASLHS